MKKVIIICSSIYLTLIAIIIIARFTNVYGLLTAIIVFIVMVSAIAIYDFFILRTIQHIADEIQNTNDLDSTISRLNSLLSKKLTKDQIIKTQFLLVIAYTYKRGELEKAKNLLEQIDFPQKKQKYTIMKLDCQLAFNIIDEDEDSYFKNLALEKEYADESTIESNRQIMTYYFQLLKDFYEPSLAQKVQKIIDLELKEEPNMITKQFYQYLDLLAQKAQGLPLNGIQKLMNQAQGTYLIDKLNELKEND